MEDFAVQQSKEFNEKVTRLTPQKKCLEMFAEIAELNDDHKKFSEQFGVFRFG